MRVVIFILILAVAVLLIAIATGFLDIRQTRGARAPDVSADNGVTASGGQAPAFDIETGSVSVGTTRANVVVPTVRVNPADEQSNAAADDAVANNAN